MFCVRAVMMIGIGLCKDYSQFPLKAQSSGNQKVTQTWRKDSPKGEFRWSKVEVYSEESPTLLRSFSSEEHRIVGVLKLFTILLTWFHYHFFIEDIVEICGVKYRSAEKMVERWTKDHYIERIDNGFYRKNYLELP